MKKAKNIKIKNTVTYIIFYIVFALILFVLHKAIYFGSHTTIDDFKFFNFSIKFPLIEFLLWFVCSSLSIGIYSSIPIIKKNKQSENREKKQGNKRIIVSIICSVFIIVMSSWYVVISGAGYYDNSIKFKCNDSVFRICEVDYENLEIYKLDGYYYKFPSRPNMLEPVYYEYKENGYAVSDGQGNYFEFGKLNKNSNDYKMLSDIAKHYNREIKEIRTIRDLW